MCLISGRTFLDSVNMIDFYNPDNGTYCFFCILIILMLLGKDAIPSTASSIPSGEIAVQRMPINLKKKRY